MALITRRAVIIDELPDVMKRLNLQPTLPDPRVYAFGE